MITRINLGMVNAFIIQEQGTILVDTGTKGSASKLINFLMKHKYLEKIDLIILTHNHSDHVGGLAKLLEYRNIPILMHNLDMQAMIGSIDDEIKPQVLLTRLFHLFKPNYTPIQVSPTLIMEDSFDLKPYGIKGIVFHTPGHTKGSVSIVVGDEVIIGDQIMAFRKKPHKPIVAYDLDLIQKSMQTLFDLNIERYYLSHGKDYSKNQIQRVTRILGN